LALEVQASLLLAQQRPARLYLLPQPLRA